MIIVISIKIPFSFLHIYHIFIFVATFTFRSSYPAKMTVTGILANYNIAKDSLAIRKIVAVATPVPLVVGLLLGILRTI